MYYTASHLHDELLDPPRLRPNVEPGDTCPHTPHTPGLHHSRPLALYTLYPVGAEPTATAIAVQ